jgi:flagellar hook protein FlgE
MALLNSFGSGVSAIKTFGKSLEVIGDNIANVNTTGFKSSRVLNKDAFAETLQRSSAAVGEAGGANSMQVGFGTSVASITQKFTQGALTTTAGPADLGISGKGFFKVQNPTNQSFYYTRAGDFRVDDAGNLLTSEGFNVFGAADKIVIPQQNPPQIGGAPIQSFKVQKDGLIDVYYSNGTLLEGAGQILLTTFNNPNALERIGGNILRNPGGEDGADGGAAGAQAADPANPTFNGEIIQGTLELSNVDLTQEFSDLIVAQRSFQAGSRVITVSDSIMDEIVNLKR